MDSRYQCPRCGRSYVEEIEGKKGRFCKHFTYTFLNPEERFKAKFVFRWFIWWQTRECSWTYRGWGWNCAGFRDKKRFQAST